MNGLLPIEIKNPYFQIQLDARRAAMPQPICGVGGYFIAEAEMRDGVKLITKVCVPDSGERWPCLLIRTPYDVFWGMEPINAIPFVEQGYAVAIQFCRGTCGSGGEYNPFEQERNDGIDALRWLAKQPWQDGNIGTYGSSYMAFDQWVIADSLPPEVKTMYIDSGGADWYTAVYANGMFRHDGYTGWPLGIYGDRNDPRQNYHNALKLRPHNTMCEKLLGREIPYYRGLISSPARSDPYWEDSCWQTAWENPSKINVPICVVEGWFDHNVASVMTSVKGLRPEIRKESRLVFGPWDHIGQLPGVLEYPDGGKFGPGRILLMLGWFDRMLKGVDKDTPPISEYYAIGEGKWHTFDVWPPKTKAERFYLWAGVTLGRMPEGSGNYRYEYDPGKPPLQVVGGSDLMSWIGSNGPHGPELQPDYTDRDDVLVFKSQPLPGALFMTGSPVVSLEVSSTAPDTSFMVRLSEEFEDGTTVNIVDGASSILLRNESETVLEYMPGEKVVLSFRMYDIAWELKKGSRLRLDVSSSNFPMYHLHPNKVGIWSAIEDWDKAEQTVYFGSERSAIYLPILC